MEKLKKFLSSDFCVLIFRLLILYLVLFICRIVFYFKNQDLLGILNWNDLPTLLQGCLKFDTISILYLNTPFIVLSLIPFHFRERNFYQGLLCWLYMIANSVGIVLMNLADAIYFRYSSKRISLEELHFFQENDNNGNIMLRSVFENWPLVILAIVLILAMLILYKIIKYKTNDDTKPVKYYLMHSLILVFAVIMYVFGVRGSFDLKARPVTLSNAAVYASNANQTSLVLSNPFCTIRMLGVKKFSVRHYFEDEEAASIYTPFHHPKGDFKYNLGKKNIVIFVLESFNREHSKYLMPNVVQGNGFTPFLDSLMREGYAFRKAYSNGMKSIESLPSILASIPSYQTPFPLLPQSIGEMDALPEILSHEGYETYFFSGSTANQMGFEAICKLAGIKHFYNRTHYEKKHPGENRANIWGIWDRDYLEFMAEELGTFESPFFATVYTLTSHHPFVLPAEYERQMPQGVNPLQPCVAYTDLSIRRFFEVAEQSDWFKNTIFVFVADHSSGYKAYEVSQTSRGCAAIVYFIYTPDHSIQGLSEEVTQQIDIMPTLLGLVGYDKPYFAFGRDVFNEPERKAVATNCVGQVYQCLTDSLSLYFDGQNTLQVFAANDSLQQHNILNLNDPQQKNAENLLKAILQSYTFQVNNKSYVNPENQKMK